MATTQRKFIQETFPKLLENLKEDTPAIWGIMSPQHMLEHLSALFYIARNQPMPCVTPKDKIPKAIEWLWSDRSFPKEVKAVGVPKGSLMPLRFENLDAAKAITLKTMKAYIKHFAENPDVKTVHPVFGPLDEEAWDQFHYKHIYHHFSQFGLLEINQKNASWFTD